MDTFINIIKAILFGVVEGITEWLPISSTGHIILLDEFVKLNCSPAFFDVFEVVIQLGAIMAVIIMFFGKLNPFAPSKSVDEKKSTWSLLIKILIATIPAAAVGVVLDDLMDQYLYNAWVVAVALISYGVAYIFIERKHAASNIEYRIKEVEEITYKDALKIGCFQMLSLVPGTSRSGSTILGAMMIKTRREVAAEFSFFMAIPVMLGASFLKLLKFFMDGNTMSVEEIGIILVASVVAFVVSLFAIKFLMAFVKKHSFEFFGKYRIVLGLVVLGYFAIKLVF